MNSINSFFNFAFLVAVCVGGYFYLTLPKDYGPPPSDAWFQSEVMARSGPVLVKFGADWCGPCQMLDSELDRLASQWNGRLAVVRITVDQHQNLAAHYGISGIPHLMLFSNGKVVADRVGYVDSQQLESWVAGHTR